MKESGEFPIVPEQAPVEETHYWRFESSDLDINELVKYFHSTVFESEADIKDFLLEKYRMSEREEIDEIKMGMTREYDPRDLIDIVDQTKLLKRSPEKDLEYIRKIMVAYNQKGGHVIIEKFGFFLDDEKMRKIKQAITGEALSGIEPQAVARVGIKTTDGKNLDLRIFRVYNRNQKFRYEYILEGK